MKTFNINRFWKVFTRLLLVRRRNIVKWTVTMAGLMLFILLINSRVWNITAFTNKKLLIYHATSLISILELLSFLTLNYGCLITSDLKKKQARINELMLPGTKLEKYVARLAYTSVVFFLMVATAFVCTDILQQGITMLVHEGARVSITGLLWDNKISTNYNSPIWAYISGYLLINSTAVLGGVIFRKVAWLKTWIAVGIILLFIFFLGFLFVTYIYIETDYELYLPASQKTVETLSCLGMTATSLVFYWLAYKIYSRLQVINNRWVNL